MADKKGLWICIDGPDFTGKGTQCGILISKLIEDREDNIIAYTHEPTAKAQEIKRKLKEEKGQAYKDPMVMAEFYIADRVLNEERIIRPILKDGGIVISNRHKYSTDAYQSSQGVDFETLTSLQKKMGVGTPHITVFLAISAGELSRRMRKSQKEPDKFESDLIFQHKVTGKYDSIARIVNTDRDYFGNIHVINAEGDPNGVSKMIWAKIEPFYRNWLA